MKNPCPPDYQPGCSCYILGTEPDDDCHVHGYPDPRRCPYCNAFYTPPCKRCGCTTPRPEPLDGEHAAREWAARECGYAADAEDGKAEKARLEGDFTAYLKYQHAASVVRVLASTIRKGWAADAAVEG